MKSILVVLFVIGAATCAVLNKDTGKIVGGYEAEKAAHPYQVHLQLTLSYWGIFTQTVWGCGGSIINNKWILTAAHCVYDQSGKVLKASAIKIRAGQHDSSILESHAQNYNVIRVIPHAQYNSRDMSNDIALLELAGTGVVYNDKVKPVALAISGSSPVTNTEAIVSGWGATSAQGPSSEILLAVAVHIVDTASCNTAYGGSIVPGMICAAADGKDSCQGDSGGPLVDVQPSGEHLQIGVVSFGMGCADPGYPGVYAGVGHYRTWIQQQVGI